MIDINVGGTLFLDFVIHAFHAALLNMRAITKLDVPVVSIGGSYCGGVGMRKKNS